MGSWSFNDVATDDAVSNDPNNPYRLMATGSWRADNNPMDQWQYLRASWQYLNKFIFIADDVNWAADPLVAEMFRDRLKGDAFGMRRYICITCFSIMEDGQKVMVRLFGNTHSY